MVAHETTHALVDGLRERFTDPVLAGSGGVSRGLLRCHRAPFRFSLRDVVDRASRPRHFEPKSNNGSLGWTKPTSTPDALRKSLLFGLAEQMGQEMSQVRGQALRRSIVLDHRRHHSQKEEFQEPHRRGEILVAVMLNAFLEVWSSRLKALHQDEQWLLDRTRVVEEGGRRRRLPADDVDPRARLFAAGPSRFPRLLSALLTADYEIRPDDSKYQFRRHLLQSFRRYG